MMLLQPQACRSHDRRSDGLGAIAITAPDGLEHLVPDAAFVEQCEIGWYPARCGKWVCSASLCVPAGERCCGCEPAWACAS